MQCKAHLHSSIHTATFTPQYLSCLHTAALMLPVPRCHIFAIALTQQLLCSSIYSTALTPQHWCSAKHYPCLLEQEQGEERGVLFFRCWLSFPRLFFVCVWGGGGRVVYVHIPERGVRQRSKEQGLKVGFWAKRDPSAQKDKKETHLRKKRPHLS